MPNFAFLTPGKIRTGEIEMPVYTLDSELVVHMTCLSEHLTGGCCADWLSKGSVKKMK